ncbi:MAG: glycine--tRNA ligase [Verrucomicrobiales bacterium]|jgi:glycyl-tRNA synthetase|nr:glycine--tRNA ligase [Verrucomicrobiales bacterium]
MPETTKMEKIVALSKRRGFIFQSSEIYGGLNGFWDYGPLGSQLKKNIRDHWWRAMTQLRADIVGMDGAIIMNPAVWRASGHVDTFSDPMCSCKHCKKLLRADQVWTLLAEQPWAQAIAGLFDPATRVVHTAELLKWANGKGKHLSPGLALVRNPAVVLSCIAEREASGVPLKDAREFYQYLAAEQYNQTGPITPCPYCGGELTAPRNFNLMLKTYIGPVQDESAVAYLRPETAQAMFVQFKNVLDTSRQKLPFGIAQVGKSFRNEINPRNFTFRSREFDQMEVEFFVPPDDGFKWTDRWLEDRLAWYEAVGLPRHKIHVLDVPAADRAFYSKKTYDLEYEFPFGVQELEGIAYRTDYDLGKHQEHSGKPLEYFDEASKRKFIPHVVEPSAGLDRTLLAILCEAFDEEQVADGDIRTVLRFKPCVAPIKAGVFPLLKNKPELVAKAREVEALLRPLMAVQYDDGGAIGRRYRRQDEIGTPFCVTVDFETLEGVKEGADTGKQDTVTLRQRDSMQQERVTISALPAKLLAAIG